METYTFSRALHLMRYSNKKMRPLNGLSPFYFYVDVSGILRFHDPVNKYTGEAMLPSHLIMGSWAEVK